MAVNLSSEDDLTKDDSRLLESCDSHLALPLLLSNASNGLKASLEPSLGSTEPHSTLFRSAVITDSLGAMGVALEKIGKVNNLRTRVAAGAAYTLQHADCRVLNLTPAQYWALSEEFGGRDLAIATLYESHHAALDDLRRVESWTKALASTKPVAVLDDARLTISPRDKPVLDALSTFADWLIDPKRAAEAFRIRHPPIGLSFTSDDGRDKAASGYETVSEDEEEARDSDVEAEPLLQKMEPDM